MELGVNVPNYGPGTDPGILREWRRTVEGLGFGLLMVSDHVVVTPDVAVRYPEPFFEPFTTLSWLAGITTRVWLGTTVVVLPYRHPLLEALGPGSAIPVWIGGNSVAAIRRAFRFGAGWHPLRCTLSFLRDALAEHALPSFAPIPSRPGTRNRPGVRSPQ